MQLITTTEKNAIIVSPLGRIDHASADAFSTAISPFLEQCRTGTPPLILDFSGVEYISSVGLRVLVLAARQTKSQGGRIAIASLSPMVQEIFTISRFDLIFDVFDSVDAAIASLL